MRKISELDTYVRQVEEYAGISLESYVVLILRKHLVDFDRFRDAVLVQLKKNKPLA